MDELPEIKIMFDGGSGVCLWSACDLAYAKFGSYPLSAHQIGVTEEIALRCKELIARYDSSINFDDPGGDSLWDSKTELLFQEDVDRLVKDLKTILRGELVVFEFPLPNNSCHTTSYKAL